MFYSEMKRFVKDNLINICDSNYPLNGELAVNGGVLRIPYEGFRAEVVERISASLEKRLRNKIYEDLFRKRIGSGHFF